MLTITTSLALTTIGTSLSHYPPTTTPAEKFVYTSSRQRLACIGPLERLCHSSVEVLDEVDQRLMQLLDGVETGAFEQAPNQDAKPNLDLREPGGMLGGIDKADPVVRIGYKGGPGCPGLEDTVAVLDAEVHLDTTLVRDPFDQRSGLMGVEVVDDKQPRVLRRLGNGLLDVGQKIGLGTARPHAGGYHSPGGDFPVSDQAQRAMAIIFMLNAGHLTRPHGRGEYRCCNA